MTLSIAHSSATMTGLEHLRLGRNNQDALEVREADGAFIAVVTDGCSSSLRSEVGANVTASIVADELMRFALERSSLHEVSDRVLERLRGVARLIASNSEGVQEIVGRSLLCSIVAVVITKTSTHIVGAGDGVYCINGSLTHVLPDANNAPNYLAYGVCPHAKRHTLEHWHACSTEAVQWLIIGSDGLEPLARWLREAGQDRLYTANRSWLQRRMRMEFAQTPHAHDDATLVLVHRNEEKSPCAS